MQPAKTEPAASALSEALACGPQKVQFGELRFSPSQSLSVALCCNGLRGIFVYGDEVAQRHRKRRILGGTERVHSQLSLEPDHEHSESERIESRVEQDQIVGEWCQGAIVFFRNLFHLGRYR